MASSFPEWKFIIAPHEVNAGRISELTDLFQNSIRYSELYNTHSKSIDNQDLSSNNQVLIIDNIGLLSSVYQYGDVAYIGGGFGVGIHNTLEAAAFGLPVIFGPNYQKFNEAIDLISAGAAFTIKNQEELQQCMEILQMDDKRDSCGKSALNYVKTHTGATRAILNYIGKI